MRGLGLRGGVGVGVRWCGGGSLVGVGGGRSVRAEEPEGAADPALDGVVDPHSVARTILLDKLTGQPRTRAELAGLLAEREIPDEVADEVLDRFTEVGLIDDAAFATAWVDSRHRGRGLGKRALAQELRRRGVDDELARDALDELDPDQEEETARALVRRKLRSMRSLDRQVAMRRLLGMLARKGYPGGLAYQSSNKNSLPATKNFPSWTPPASNPTDPSQVGPARSSGRSRSDRPGLVLPAGSPPLPAQVVSAGSLDQHVVELRVACRRWSSREGGGVA